MKVLVASNIAPDALEVLRTRHDVVVAVGASESTLIELIGDRQALVFRSGVTISRRVLEAADSLQLIVRAGSGYDNIDIDHLATRKIRVVRIPGPGAKAVAEMSFALMLALARQLFWADANWRAGHWVKAQASGRLLTGATLGVVGAGNIGSRTGQLGASWGMKVIGCIEHQDRALTQPLRHLGIELRTFDEVMSNSDFVSVHVPLKDSTWGMIGEREIAMMRPGSFLVNLARGGIVDERALRDALVDGHLAGAALDVHEAEGEGRVSGLADLDNVILTPHIGASTSDSQSEIGSIIIGAIDEYEFEPVTDLATVENFIIR